MLTGKPFVFAAGADLTEFPKLTDPELARAPQAKAGHDAFAAIRALPFPTLAAINGAAVGGGLEIALHCDFRTIARSVRHIGFPEVFLGIIPGWGGTQLAPRLVGAASAVELIVANPLRQNRLVGAAEAVEIGLADALLDDVEFLDDSIEWLVRAIEEKRPPPDAPTSPTPPRSARRRPLRGRRRRPRRRARPVPRARADRRRRDLDARGGLRRRGGRARRPPARPQAQAAVYAFDLVERRVKRGAGIPEATPRRIEKVGVVGAGLMATQLATLFLRRLEVPLVITDVDGARVGEALVAIRAELGQQVAKGRLTESKARFLGSIVTGATDTARLRRLRPRDRGRVRGDRRQAGGARSARGRRLGGVPARDEHVVALGGGDGAGLRHPERVVGMHFFNPVAVLPLVELVRTPATDDLTLATAWDVTEEARQARRPRQGRARVRRQPAADPAVERADAGARARQHLRGDGRGGALKLGIPMPPSALLAMVGPRVANHVLETLHDAYPDRFPLSPTLENFANGELDIVLTGDARQDGRRDLRRDPRGARRRVPAPARRGRRRLGGRDRRLHDPRGRLPVLPRRHHEAPRPGGHLATGLGPSARPGLKTHHCPIASATVLHTAIARRA